MSIEDVVIFRLNRVYHESRRNELLRLGRMLEPEIEQVVRIFYTELMDVPELVPMLENAIVEKNLQGGLCDWTRALFQPRDAEQVREMIEYQRKIGSIHAHLNVDLDYVSHGMSILKRELYRRIQQKDGLCEESLHGILLLGELFDVLLSLLSEAYFAHEIIHETNELSLKLKAMSQNAAVECERLRSMLLDWFRRAQTFLYDPDEFDPSAVPKLENSNFSLWVLYKADLLYHGLNLSAELSKHIRTIDEHLVSAVGYRVRDDRKSFSLALSDLDEAVTQASWYISSVVDQVMELDTGTDPMTRLFNRRYLDTILRRQTHISMRRGLAYSLLLIDLDHFKMVNDVHGHESGDLVLEEFSALLLKSVRTSDFVFRYGGEEFLVILGNVGRKQATLIAEKIRENCMAHPFELPRIGRLQVTCSIGVASFAGHPDYNTIVKKADEALYEAKGAGRNRIAYMA